MRAGLWIGAALALSVAAFASFWSGMPTPRAVQPALAGAPTSTPTPVPCADGPCRMELAATGPSVVCEAAKCSVPAGANFTLAVELVSVPQEGYILAQSWVEFGGDLMYNPAGDAMDEVVLPDCPIVVRGRLDQGNTHVSHGCLTALQPPLPRIKHKGNFVEISLTCSAAETSTVVRLLPAGEPTAGTEGALFQISLVDGVTPDVGDLTINCVSTLLPTFTPTHTPTPVNTATNTPTLPPGVTPSDTPTRTPTLPPGVTPSDTPPTSPTVTPQSTGQPTATGTPPTATPQGPTATQSPVSSNTPPPTQQPPPLLGGDANCDGTVNPVDATFILQFTARLLAALPCRARSDASGDGTIDPLDAALILQYSAGLVAQLPP